jgi:hypothetical protein
MEPIRTYFISPWHGYDVTHEGHQIRWRLYSAITT